MRMERIFLVKTDPAKPASEDNWTVMDAAGFAAFAATPEGKRRMPDFGRLAACGAGDAVIVAECGRTGAAELRRERDRRAYLRRQERDSGYTTVSLEALGAAAEIGIQDGARRGAEETAVRRVMTSEALRALGTLSGEERGLMRAMYLDGVPERILAERLGVSQQAVSRRKRRMLERLRGEMEKGESF